MREPLTPFEKAAWFLIAFAFFYLFAHLAVYMGKNAW